MNLFASLIFIFIDFEGTKIKLSENRVRQLEYELNMKNNTAHLMKTTVDEIDRNLNPIEQELYFSGNSSSSQYSGSQHASTPFSGNFQQE